MTTPKTNEYIAHKAHLKWLSKAGNAKFKGTEMIVLPYGYLSQAIMEALTQKDTEIQKAREEWLKIIKNTDRKFANNYEAEIMKAAYLLAKADIIEALAPPKQVIGNK